MAKKESKKQEQKEQKEQKEKREKQEQSNPSSHAPSRRWVFTLYPEKLLEKGALLKKTIDEIRTPEGAKEAVQSTWEYLYGSVPSLRGAMISLEEGDTKEHVHLQGYMELRTPSRLIALVKKIECGIHLESCTIGTRDHNEDYIFHQGKHKDKGVLYYAEKFGAWPDTSGTERGAYDQAINMVLEGIPVALICKKLGGAILPQIGNLCRLQTEMEKERTIDLCIVKRKMTETEEWLEWDRNNDSTPF
jgi:hypothetical protein